MINWSIGHVMSLYPPTPIHLQRSDSSQPESPLLERRNRAKTTLGHIFTAALEGKREGKGHGSGFQSDSGISEESLSNTIQKVSL